MRTRMLDRAVTNVYNARLDEFGIKLSQMNVLIAIAKLSPAAPGTIAQGLHLEASTLSRNVERLRGHGYVEVVAGDDARSRLYRLSESGRKLIEEAYPSWRLAQRQVKKMLGEEGTEVLLEFSRTRPFDTRES